MNLRRERVLAAIKGGKPDRVPVDFGANAGTLSRLKSELGCSSHAELLARLNVDIVDLRDVAAPRYCGPVPKETVRPDGVKENFWGWRTRVMQTPTGPEECFCEFQLQHCDTLDELAAYRWPSPDWFDFGDFSQQVAQWDDFAIMATGASVFQHVSFLRGQDRLLMDMAAEPELAEFVMDRFTDFYVEYYDRMLSAAKGRIDILRIADDIGMQDRLLIGPEQFDSFVAPRLKRIVAMAHEHGAKVMFHSCGAILPLIDRLITFGIDILDPLQAAAKDMDPSVLKEQFGARICLHGGIDTQHLLPHGTPEEVNREVRRRIAVLGAGGGYILAPCHVLQTDVPTANILAMYEVARESRG